MSDIMTKPNSRLKQGVRMPSSSHNRLLIDLKNVKWVPYTENPRHAFKIALFAAVLGKLRAPGQ